MLICLVKSYKVRWVPIRHAARRVANVLPHVVDKSKWNPLHPPPPQKNDEGRKLQNVIMKEGKEIFHGREKAQDKSRNAESVELSGGANGDAVWWR
jgi:hypothetical protein